MSARASPRSILPRCLATIQAMPLAVATASAECRPCAWCCRYEGAKGEVIANDLRFNKIPAKVEKDAGLVTMTKDNILK